jgi:hypothetical protein
MVRDFRAADRATCRMQRATCDVHGPMCRVLVARGSVALLLEHGMRCASRPMHLSTLHDAPCTMNVYSLTQRSCYDEAPSK